MITPEEALLERLRPYRNGRWARMLTVHECELAWRMVREGRLEAVRGHGGTRFKQVTP